VSIIRVLCVEDNSLVQDYMVTRLALEPDVRIVGLADSADTALVQLTWEPVDVVLLDHQLTGSSGMQLLRTLRERHAREDEPRTRGKAEPEPLPRRPAVLFCTGRAQEILQSAWEWGADGVIAKERLFTDLVPALRAVAAGGTWYRSGN
jgi:DNA-binding NarL/FixJ family response regulator